MGGTEFGIRPLVARPHRPTCVNITVVCDPSRPHPDWIRDQRICLYALRLLSRHIHYLRLICIRSDVLPTRSVWWSVPIDRGTDVCEAESELGECGFGGYCDCFLCRAGVVQSEWTGDSGEE